MVKLLTLMFCLAFIQNVVAQVQITVDANKKDKPISRNLFGLFTEHLGRNVYGGAWAQLVENPEFVPASYWPVRDYGNLMERNLYHFQQTFQLTDLVDDSKNGFAAYWVSSANLQGRLLKEGNHDFQRIETEDKAGYIQTGVFLPLHRTSGYELTLRARSEKQTNVVLQILDLEENVIGETNFELNSGWETIKKAIQVTASEHQKGDAYLLRLFVEPGTVYEFARMLCFPDDHIDGWEPEMVALLKNMKLPLLRFPGGNFVSGYHWMDGVGPIDQRPALPNPAWHGMEWNHVGTDEWINLCRLIGAEPMICVNAGNGTAEEAANWVKYCNDPASTPMGKLRAENGYDEPFNVKIWEVGNELCGEWQIGFTDGDDYARRYAMFAPRLLEADSSISLIANGLIKVLEKSELISRGVDPEWNYKLMDYNGELVRSVSVHSLVGRAVDENADPVEAWKDLVAFAENYPDFLHNLVVEPMQQANVEPKIAITELMDWPQPRSVGNVTSISGALWYSGIINICIRSNGLVGLVTRSALINHGGGLQKDRGIIYTQPVYWSHFMYTSQNGTIPLDVQTTSPGFASSGKYVIKKENIPAVDAAALMDQNRSSTSVFICNRDAKTAHEVELTIEGFNSKKEAALMMIGNENLALRNSWEKPEAIAPVFDKISVKENRIKYTIPPLAMVRIILDAE
ncbi:alpha-L-arabinofuranosidase C-terminal domain-containing protein [Draconibacterium mangrovi]|uniref:alpha-L-arabinofuranosidase C-terminal domain-containing protein n=1 Tax=Draconibacterium mangrovi TaxID=2697469 RepID=UPI0013D09EC4|nr:alpha-L-arabinofuranosidase C-terminal domain-containing protein [Draconibacterium mangrovi]